MSSTTKLAEAYREGDRIYYRVFADEIEKPSLVFVHVSDLVRHGETALKIWCEHNLNRLDSGTVVEAKLPESDESR